MPDVNEHEQLGHVQTIPVRTSKTNNGSKATLISYLLAHKAKKMVVLEACQQGHQPRGDDEINLTNVILLGCELKIVTKKDKTIPVRTTERNNVNGSKAPRVSLLAHEAKETEVFKQRGDNETDLTNVPLHGGELKTVPKKRSGKVLGKEHYCFVTIRSSSSNSSSSSSTWSVVSIGYDPLPNANGYTYRTLVGLGSVFLRHRHTIAQLACADIVVGPMSAPTTRTVATINVEILSTTNENTVPNVS